MQNKFRAFFVFANLMIGLIISFLPALYFVTRGLVESYLALTSPNWEATQSISLYVIDDEGGRTFSYYYLVGDVVHESHRFSFAYPFPDERIMLEQYQDGQSVDVYYSSYFPAQATLRTGWGWGPLVFIGLGIVLLGIGTIAFRWGLEHTGTSSIDPVNWA